jgi:putative glycerol-1-phosphate prenyltransferase
MKNSLLTDLHKKGNKKPKKFALLLDPDSFESNKSIQRVCKVSEESGVDLLLVGGSLIANGNLEDCVKTLRKYTTIPVYLFPGDNLQISEQAHGILLLSLISGRNADLLIGKHVLAAPRLKKSKLQIVPTGYMLIDGGHITSVSYMSNTTPIPSDKADIAMCTAMAGELLGLQLIYMDAGSGAAQPITESMIKRVKGAISIPLVVGGGIRTPDQAVKACKAGADVIVVGNAVEKDIELIREIAAAVHSVKA